MTQLRGYQKELKAGIYSAWQQGAQCVIGATATGSGKTVTMASMAGEIDGRGVIQAHRAELVGQLSLALAREGVRHNITAAKSTVRAICDAHMEEVGACFYVPGARWNVASVDTLIKRGDPEARKATHVFTDECFPAGTSIDGVPIEHVKVGDAVRTFDEHAGQILTGRVVRTMRNSAPAEMVRVSVSHHVLECTKGHPFFTRRGWVPAALLTDSDHVLIADLHAMRNPVQDGQRGATIPAPQDRASILQTGMRLCASTREHGSEGAPIAARCCMQDVWQAGRPKQASAITMESHGAGVLQSGMFECISGARVIDCDGENQSQVRISTDVGEQPNGGCIYTAEGARHTASNGACAKDSRRERAAGHTCRDCAGSNAVPGRVCSAVCSGDRQGEILGMAEPLQNRLRAPATQNCDRSGRHEPFDSGAASAGCTQGRVSAWARVDRVEVFQWADTDRSSLSDGGRFVYNFEVERYHTYIAGGVVVHNCHHVLADNKWGKAVQMYPQAKYLGVTATPCRADGKGLGRHHDGLADALVIGPGLADLMGQGYLTTYRVAEAQAADLDMSDVHMTAGGDFNMQEAARAVKRSNRIVGDAVATYKELIPGKRAILFAADIEHAQTLADAFNAASVPAAIVTGETEEATRRTVMKRFKAKELLVLINVDLFGEGVDVPAVDAVIMCRPTASFSLYAQQIGRMLRLMISPVLMAAWDTFTVAQRMAHIAASEKSHGVLIDHVGNIRREFKIGEHTYRGLPEGFNAWSLDRRQRRRSGGGDGIPVRMCDGCFKPYERIFDSCPYCGKLAPPPAMRGGPEQVDGDVTWLDDETLAKLRGQIAIIDGAPRVPQNVGPAIQVQAIRLHQERQAAQHHLREAIAQWAGWHHLDSNTTNYRRFFHTFGLDVLTAMGLGAGEAAKLTERIKQTYTTP